MNLEKQADLFTQVVMNSFSDTMQPHCVAVCGPIEGTGPARWLLMTWPSGAMSVNAVHCKVPVLTQDLPDAILSAADLWAPTEMDVRLFGKPCKAAKEASRLIDAAMFATRGKSC